MDGDRSVVNSRVARAVLGVGVCAYIAFYMFWGLRSYANFETFGYDFGVHDQAVWLLSRFHQPFVTISGTHYFGDHLSWMSLVLVPFYWVSGSARALPVLQALALGLAAVPAFLVARVKLRSEWLACGIAWIVLLNPYLSWANVDLFHPDVFEVGLTLLAFLFVLRRRWRLFVTVLVLLMLVKEDVPLLAVGLGIWVAVLYNRRVGVGSTAVALLWLFVNFRFLLPALSGTGSLAQYVTVHADRIPFGGLGGFFRTLVTKPWRVVAEFFGSGRPSYYLKVFLPLGFLPFLSPSTLLAVILPLVVSGLSTFVYQHSIQYHYGTLVVPGLIVALVFGIAHGSARLRKIMVCFVLLTSMVGLWLWGPVPGSRDPGAWNNVTPEFAQAAGEALKMIPGDAVVSADYRMVTHLTHRVEVYEFPNPFYVLNWGGRPTGTAMPDIEARVQYVLVSRGADARSQLVLQRVLDSGDFESIFDREGLRLLKRARSAAAVPGINGIGGAPQASVARRQSQT